MSRDVWVWIRVPVRAILRAIKGLKELSMQGHEDAREADNKDQEQQLRRQADDDYHDADRLQKALDSDEVPPPMPPRKKT